MIERITFEMVIIINNNVREISTANLIEWVKNRKRELYILIV